MQTVEEIASGSDPIGTMKAKRSTLARVQIVKNKLLHDSADQTVNFLIDFWEKSRGGNGNGRGQG